MKPSDATRRELETAIEDIQRVLFQCRECGEFTFDDTSVSADSAADGIEAIMDILSNHDLLPDESTHSKLDGFGLPVHQTED